MIINNNSLLLRLGLAINPDYDEDRDEEEDGEDDYDVMIAIPGGNVGNNHLIKSSNCSKVGALNSSTGM